MLPLSPERPLIVVIASLTVLDLLLITLKHISVDYAGYAVAVSIGTGLFAAGQFYGRVRREERLNATLSAAGLFILFTVAGSAFNYLLLPVQFASVDPFLVRLDAVFGFDWPTFVAHFAQWPFVSWLLLLVYLSSMAQLIAVVLILGFTGRTRTLWHFLFTGVIGALTCIVIWSFFPSFGASAVQDLPQSVLDAVPVVVSPKYNAEVVRLSREGVNFISPRNVLGLIGFPSFHTIMACMSVVFVARIRWFFPLAVFLNLTMVPAILVHGGHHLTDFLGGLAVFAIAYRLGSVMLDGTVIRAPLSASRN